MKKTTFVLGAFALLSALCLSLYALTGGSFDLSSIAIGSGGGKSLSGGNLEVKSSMGPSGAASLSGGNFEMKSGFIGGSLLAAASTLNSAHAYPVPFMPSKSHTNITFTDLTPQATIKIYTISGELVKTLNKEDSSDSLAWNVKNDDGDPLASGVYIFSVESPTEMKKGKLMVIK